MAHISKRLLALATLAVVLLGTTQSASANLTLYLQEDAGPIVQVATNPTNFDPLGVSFSGNFGSFAVSVQGGASFNSATQSGLLNSTTSVTNTTGTTATLHLWVSQDSYTLPPGTPLAVESGLGGSLLAGTLALNDIFQAYADSGNAQLGMSFTNGPQTATPTGSTFDTGSAFGTFDRTGPYSLTSVANITLSGGGIANYSSQVNVTPVPEPATVALALTGLPTLGLFWLRRWRHA